MGKLTWTQAWRRLHKKGLETTTTKRRTRRTNKVQRAVVGISLEEIRKKASQKPEFRTAQREAAMKEAKARQQKAKESKKKTSYQKVEHNIRHRNIKVEREIEEVHNVNLVGFLHEVNKLSYYFVIMLQTKCSKLFILS